MTQSQAVDEQSCAASTIVRLAARRPGAKRKGVRHETDLSAVRGALPPTAVRVVLARETEGLAQELLVKSIGSGPDPLADGIEAGLYLCTGAVLTALTDLTASRSYFRLSDAMRRLASAGRLGAMATAGRAWFAFETSDQLRTAARSTTDDSGRARFPWQVSIARADSFSNVTATAGALPVAAASSSSEPVASHRLVLAIPDGVGMQVRPPPGREAQHFSLLPGRSQAAVALAPAVGDASLATLAQPLLLGGAAARGSATIDAIRVTASIGGLAGAAEASDAVALSIAVEPGRPRLVYLIHMPRGKPAPAGLVLAVPAAQEAAPPMLACMPRWLPTLPTGIESIELQQAPAFSPAADEPPVTLTVRKHVPNIGYGLLLVALLASYSGGPATDLQRVALPCNERRTFLRAVWRGTCGALVMLIVSAAYPQSQRDLVAAARFRLARATTLRLLGAGLAFSVSFGAFSVALEHTSISHAALFESCSSIWLVLAQCSAALFGRKPKVPRSQILGVAFGAAGGVMMTLDVPSDAPAEGRGQQVSLGGDLAGILAGVGAAAYFSLAEKVRLRLDPFVFYLAVLVQYALYCLALAFVLDSAPPELSTDPLRGGFGWLALTPSRLPMQLWLGIVFDFAGDPRCFELVAPTRTTSRLP